MHRKYIHLRKINFFQFSKVRLEDYFQDVSFSLVNGEESYAVIDECPSFAHPKNLISDILSDGNVLRIYIDKFGEDYDPNDSGLTRGQLADNEKIQKLFLDRVLTCGGLISYGSPCNGKDRKCSYIKQEIVFGYLDGAVQPVRIRTPKVHYDKYSWIGNFPTSRSVWATNVRKSQ